MISLAANGGQFSHAKRGQLSDEINNAWAGYRGLTALGYRHQAVNVRRSALSASAELPAIHRVASLLKRWWLGTHQGSISAEHLGYYLDEFTFRFNRRGSRRRGLLFYRLLQKAVQTKHAPYRSIVGQESTPSRSR